MRLLAATLALCLIPALPRASQAQLIHCDILRTSDSAYAGRCERDGWTVALLVLRPPADPARGRWYGTQARIFSERGTDTADVVDWTAFAPTFVDIGSPDSLFNWCWCRVTAASIDTNGLHFDADPARTAPPSAEDLEILRLTRSYFPDAARWNRRDTRNRAITYCPRDPSSRTLFCALYDATAVVRGDNYWGGAGAAIQAAIRAATTHRYRHPITEFNNDPDIDFATLTRMLDDAARRVREAIDSPTKGGTW